MWDYIMVPFGYIMKFGYDLFDNYAFALFFYALVTKVLLFPLSMKQQKSSLAMVRMRPYQDQLMKKYGHNKQKYQEELMRLYEREGYSPMSGCLPTLIQLPIIMLIYNIVRRPLSFILQLKPADIKELAAKVVTNTEKGVFKGIGENFERFENYELQLTSELQKSGDIKLNTDFLGIDLNDIPSQFMQKGVVWWIILIPIVAGVTSWLVSFISQRLNKLTQPQQEGGGCSMKYMNIVMPLFSAWLSYTFSASLGIYWIASNLLAIVQTLILHKMYDPAKVLAEVEQKMVREKEKEKEKRRLAAEKRAQGYNKNSKKKRAINAQYTEVTKKDDGGNDDGVIDTEKEN